MTTLNKAIKSNEARVCIAGRLVCKQIFHKGNKTLLTMLMVDIDGNPYEAKSWSKTKAYTVFGKFKVGQSVHLLADRNDLVQPNQEYTQAKYATSRNWWLDSVDDDSVNPINHFHCWTNVGRFRASRRKPAASIMGLFQGMTEGPPKFWRGHKVAQGYYVRLLDDEGASYVALVWKNLQKNRAYKFDLDNCQRNDRVLVVNAREQDKKYQDRLPGHFVVTTIYSPQVNPNCVSPASCRNLAPRPEYETTSERPYEFSGTAVCVS